MTSIIVVGTQWGDEGKGKMIDLLSQRASLVVRAQGGNNAGHTIVAQGVEYRFHLVPSGILYPHTHCVIGGGTAIDPEALLKEIEELEGRGISVRGRLFVSSHAHVIFPYHKQLDLLYEKQRGNAAIGTTGKGIGPCYADRVARTGVQMGELLRGDILRTKLEMKQKELPMPLDVEALSEQYRTYGKRLAPFVADVEEMLALGLERKQPILFEGAHGTFLDVTFGTYPFVTSSSTLAAGICAGAGVGPSCIDHTLGVAKAYTTRVGNGPLPTALSSEEEALFLDHIAAREIGTTTGRRRRLGWFDAALVRYAVRLNGVDSLALTKLDVLDHLPRIKLCTGYRLRGETLRTPPALTQDWNACAPIYEEHEGWQTSTRNVARLDQFPSAARTYLDRIEELSGVPLSVISVGPERDRTIFLRTFFV